MIKVFYSKLASEQLYAIKEYIASDSKLVAIKFLQRIKDKIEILATYPYLGKINESFGIQSIRDFVVFGYKIIYKIDEEKIIILAIYKYVDFDEKSVDFDEE